ncbi:MAG: pseudouridine synthase [Ignavibacteria bacterium]|nr:pseudouridine synthase [Ignavibacteria bacterium]
MVRSVAEHKYFIFYKPYQVLTQFTSSDGRASLSLFNFPKGCYPVGRLDYNSEGLLIITNDKSLNRKLLNPKFRHRRTYYVQVEGIPSGTDLEQLSKGVEINIDGKLYRTLPAVVEVIEREPNLPERIPPIRFRKNIPTTWLSITLMEGKNRQVRKMTAKIGYPTLRLVRYSIEKLNIDGFGSGEIRRMNKDKIIKLLNL